MTSNLVYDAANKPFDASKPLLPSPVNIGRPFDSYKTLPPLPQTSMQKWKWVIIITVLILLLIGFITTAVVFYKKNKIDDN